MNRALPIGHNRLGEPPGAAERRCRCEGHRLAAASGLDRYGAFGRFDTMPLSRSDGIGGPAPPMERIEHGDPILAGDHCLAVQDE